MREGLLIVGLGNPLMGDDGVGDAVARRARTVLKGLPVRVECGGTDALRLVSLWHGESEVWLVDAVACDGAPGTVCRLGHDALLGLPQGHEGAHRLSLPECLRWLLLSSPAMRGVRFRFWGIAIERVDLRQGLSPGVAAAASAVSLEIAEEARRRCSTEAA